MSKVRRKLLSQNFLHEPALVARLVTEFAISQNDLVLEIGPGKGIITAVLAQRAGNVIAVGLDQNLYQFLQRRFSNTRNVLLYQRDFLVHSLPKVSYKVFANIPFAIESEIIRRLLTADNPPQEIGLVVMSSFGERFCSAAGTLLAAKYYPWFTFSIAHRFLKADFIPQPSVDAVLLKCTLLKQAMLPWSLRTKYHNFVTTAFGSGGPIINNIRGRYDTKKVESALHHLSIRRLIKPSELQLRQWVELFTLV